MKNYSLQSQGHPNKFISFFSLVFFVPGFWGDLAACTHILLILSPFAALIFILNVVFWWRAALILTYLLPGDQSLGFENCLVILYRDTGEFHRCLCRKPVSERECVVICPGQAWNIGM